MYEFQLLILQINLKQEFCRKDLIALIFQTLFVSWSLPMFRKDVIQKLSVISIFLPQFF